MTIVADSWNTVSHYYLFFTTFVHYENTFSINYSFVYYAPSIA